VQHATDFAEGFCIDGVILGAARAHAHLRDRQAVVFELRMAWARVAWSGSENTACLLGLHALGHDLDDEVDVAEAVVVEGAGDQAELALELGALHIALLNARLPQRASLLEAMVDEPRLHVLERDGNVRARERLGDLAAHRAGAHDGRLEDEPGGGVESLPR
jgi:hypothetical protein